MNMNNKDYLYIINNEVNQLISSFCVDGTEIYIVGGYLRDVLINRDCYDRDYIVKGSSAIEFAKIIADKINGHLVILDEEFDIARVVLEDKINTLDFAGCLNNNLIDDLSRRDFTINSLAMRLDCHKFEIIDIFGGQNDIKNERIKAISETNIIDDPLRILRAFRFSAQFGYEIDETTIELIAKHASLLEKPAPERISAELIKLFEGKYAGKTLNLMKELKILDIIFPEISAQRDVPPNLHHHLCLIDHSIESVFQIEQIITSLPDWVKAHLMAEFSPGIKKISYLKLAALLHDLGKPQTWTIDEDGRHRFIKHEEVGSELAEPVLKRLKLSKNALKYITKLIKHHLYPSQLIKDKDVSEKAIMRFFRRIEEDVPELIILAMADRFSAIGPEITDDIVNENINGLTVLLDKFNEIKGQIVIPKLVTGQDVMMTLNIPASPKVGKILNAVKEAQINSEIFTREEALEYIKSLV